MPPPLLLMQIKLFSGMGLARLAPNPCTLNSVHSASRGSAAGKAAPPLFGTRHVSDYTQNQQPPRIMEWHADVSDEFDAEV